MKKIIFYFAILMAFSSCDKEDNLPPNNNGVSIKTLSHTINNDGGVTLVGEINNVEIPIDYGFLITTEENETYNSINYADIKLNTGIHNGRFSIDFKSDLREGITYYYNSLALKNGEYVFGKEKSFLSNGSASPQIKSIVPDKAHLGDTIVINGLNFSKNPEVSFNIRQSKLLIKSDTLIKCIVANNPDYNADKLPKIELKIKSWTQNETVTNEFALHTPRVDSIRPFEAFPGDTITIYGDHFNKEPFGNRIIIPRNSPSFAYPKVIKASQKELVFVIRDISTYRPTIEIESQHQSIEVKNKFKHALPTITGFSKNTVKYGDKLVVYGSNFPRNNSYRDSLKYKFDSKQLGFFETYRDSLVIDINDFTNYEDFVISGLSIDFFGENISYNEDIILDENYVRLTFNQGKDISYGTIGEDLYALSYSYSYADKYLAKLNKETYYFDRLYPNDPIGKAPIGLYFSFHGSKFYSFDNDAGEINFYSYDIFTNENKKLQAFPGERRFNAFSAVVGNYLYYGLGVDNATNGGLDNIWRYSFSDNTWEFVLNLPGIDSYDTAKVKPLTFSIGSKLYIGGGQPDARTQLLDFWELDTNTNVVTRKSDLPIIISQRIEGFSLNNKGFFDFNGVTYIYNPINDEWSEKETGMNFNYYNKYMLKTEDFVYSKESNSVIKIKKSHFN